MKLERLLSLTTALLGSGRRLGAEELADRFEVSLRTVYRDIETLNRAGIPIVSYPGPDGGYEIMPSYRLDRQILTLEQLVALYTAVRGIRSATGGTDMDELLEKIGALIPERASRPSAGGLDLRHAANADVRANIRALDRAIRETRVTGIGYMDGEGAETFRTVEPMGLYLKRSAWYLWGWCRLRMALRVFRLSRVTRAQILEETFERRALTIEDIDRGRERPSDGVEATIRFQPSAKARVRDVFDAGRIVENPDGTLQVSAYYYTVEQAVEHIIRFGVHAKVLEPPEFVQALHDRALQIARLYGE